MEVITNSPQETQNLGREIGNYLINTKKGRGAAILALQGELGSGKTTFIQGLAKALGLPYRILSPTFIILREYSLQQQMYQKFYHLDLYRIKEQTELKDLGLDEIFSNPSNIVAIEWPERLGSKLPDGWLSFEFRISENNRRIIKFKSEINLKKH